ncbi:MAG: pseudouridine synthase [Gammaproteobacteria bacterium]|nr:pseudouridine synthase [Gammaproteobacteria bacterium]
MPEKTTEKLQKVLAQYGLGSRRELEQWIKAGRITVNGNVATLGDRVASDVKICVDNRLIKRELPEPDDIKVLVYNKPEGEVCTRVDPERRPTVFSQLPRLTAGRWIIVGRLDISTTGLLLFTNNGELAHRLMHPSYEIEREYAVRIKGEVTPEIIEHLLKGVELEDGFAKFNTIADGGGEGLNHWYIVTLQEGRNREVRRLWEHFNLTVSRLIRTRYGNVVLPREVRRGTTAYLDPKQVKELFELVKMDMPKAEKPKGRPVVGAPKIYPKRNSQFTKKRR